MPVNPAMPSPDCKQTLYPAVGSWLCYLKHFWVILSQSLIASFVCMFCIELKFPGCPQKISSALLCTAFFFPAPSTCELWLLAFPRLLVLQFRDSPKPHLGPLHHYVLGTVHSSKLRISRAPLRHYSPARNPAFLYLLPRVSKPAMTMFSQCVFQEGGGFPAQPLWPKVQASEKVF